jgi:hypothetical protein
MILARAILAYLFLAAAVTPVGAQTASADLLFREGRRLMEAGQLAQACAAFEHSQRLDPAVTTLLNLAGCREKLGQLATAWELFLDAERQTRSARDPMTEQLHKVARDRVAAIEQRVPKLTIRVPEHVRIDGLEILRGQERVPAEMWNHPLPMDGGTYTITARAPRARAWSAHVTLASEAGRRTVDIPDLRSLGRDPDEPAGTRGRSAAAVRRGRGPALALGVGAVALLGVALGLSLWADSTIDVARAEQIDQQRRDSLESSANRKLYAAQSLAAVGVGCAGVALWLYLRRPGARAEPASTAVGPLLLAPAAPGLGISGRF